MQLEKTLVNLLNYYDFLAYLHPTRNRKAANIYPNISNAERLSNISSYFSSVLISWHFLTLLALLVEAKPLTKPHFVLESDLSFGEKRQFFLSSIVFPIPKIVRSA